MLGKFFGKVASTKEVKLSGPGEKLAETVEDIFKTIDGE